MFCKFINNRTDPENAEDFPARDLPEVPDGEETILSTEVPDVWSGEDVNDGNDVYYSPDRTRLVQCGNSDLEKYEVGEGTKVICDGAFYDCTSLVELKIPGVVAIGGRAFENCTELKSISLPPTLEIITHNPFTGCEGIKVSSESRHFSVDGDMLTKGDRLVAYTGDDEVVTVPDYIKEIGDGAFEKSGVKRVNLPSGLVSIGADAFSDCSKLVKIELPSGLVSIGTEAFWQCFKLLKIELPSGLVSIGNRAFEGCRRLSRLVLPSSLREITGNPFCGCGKVDITSKSPFFKAENNFLIQGGRLISYSGDDECPRVPDGVTAIGEYVFSALEIKKAYLPRGLESIGNNVFSSCGEMEEIDLPLSLTYIGDEAFAYCYSLKRADLPSGLKHIGEAAFDGCKHLREVKIPTGLTSIGVNVFRDCTRLTNVVFPPETTSIGMGAFSGCRKLEIVRLPAGTKTIEDCAFKGCKNLKKIEMPGVESIGESAFSRCAALRRVNLPESLREMNGNPFLGCGHPQIKSRSPLFKTVNGLLLKDGKLLFVIKDAESIVLPECVTEISAMAFFDCDKLKYVGAEGERTEAKEELLETCRKLISFNDNIIGKHLLSGFFGDGDEYEDEDEDEDEDDEA